MSECEYCGGSGYGGGISECSKCGGSGRINDFVDDFSRGFDALQKDAHCNAIDKGFYDNTPECNALVENSDVYLQNYINSIMRIAANWKSISGNAITKLKQLSDENKSIKAEVERLKDELHKIKIDNNLYPVKCMKGKCEFVKGTEQDCTHSKPHKFIPGVCDESGCNDGCMECIDILTKPEVTK